MIMARHPAMTEALRLTRAGKLADATRLIQGALSGETYPVHPRAAGPGAVIDLTPNVRPASGQQGPSPASRRHGEFLHRSYSGSAGTLDYRLYVPAAVQPLMPLVVMLHGCTQSPEDFARGTDMNRLAEELGFVVAYPGQTRAANAQKCWNWFRPGDQRRGQGEPALIAAVTRQVVEDLGCDPTRLYVAGLSAGGAAAAIMGEAYPDLYAAIGIHSGLACGAARDMPSALSAMRNGGRAAPASDHFVPVITFHGDSDHIVSETNSRHIIAAASRSADRLDLVAEKGTSPGGRRYTRAISNDAQGRTVIEQWTIHGAGHAWSGGARGGSYTDPSGPDASREMLRFFLTHRKPS
jgi:poly(hydroxyalkanoate) depolymerase family esterase